MCLKKVLLVFAVCCVHVLPPIFLTALPLAAAGEVTSLLLRDTLINGLLVGLIPLVYLLAFGITQILARKKLSENSIGILLLSFKYLPVLIYSVYFMFLFFSYGHHSLDYRLTNIALIAGIVSMIIVSFFEYKYIYAEN